MAKHITRSPKQTSALGAKIAKSLQGGQVLALHGKLGAGKTTFVKGLALGLNIKKIITSPTFVLMNVYPVVKNKHGIKRFVHVDAYRASGEADFLGVGLDEYIGDEQSIVAVEWAEKIKKILPKNCLDIKFEHRVGPPHSVSVTILEK